MSPPEHTPVRADGALARQRLLMAALRCFAEQGYSKTSTRQIAQAAEVNLAAISYYFGSKADLYRAVLGMLCERADAPSEGPVPGDFPEQLSPEMGLEAVLAGFFYVALQSLKQGEVARLAMRVHFREIVEPSGEASDLLLEDTRRTHHSLCNLICQHLQLSGADDEVRRLALSIHGLVIFHYVARELLMQIEPNLLGTPESIDALAASLTRQSMAMVEHEVQRRKELS